LSELELELGQQARVESLLVEGLDSGKSIAVTDDWWNTKRAALDLLHRSRIAKIDLAPM
jgi:ABC-type metal ion transport system substrate-binding protein